jgi:hypothetical protein
MVCDYHLVEAKAASNLIHPINDGLLYSSLGPF